MINANMFIMFKLCPARFITNSVPKIETGIPRATQKDSLIPKNIHRITNTSIRPLIPLPFSIFKRSRMNLDISDQVCSVIPSGISAFLRSTYSRTALAILMLSSSAVL